VPLGLALLLALPPLPQAQQATDVDVQPFKPAELEQIVAPLALYPDPLVAQVLMASTYPLEVIQAARFAKNNPNLKDAALDEQLTKQNWDDSVKSLVSFPQILEMMNDQVEWMQKLGDAFLGQQRETMDAIQRLRAKAQAAGNLKSNEQQTVIVEQAEGEPIPAPPAGQPPTPPQQQTIIRIEPAKSQIIYVPTYNPIIVYGVWPYPAYPPYYYYPPFYPVGYFATTAAISFGVGFAVGAAMWGGCNWRRGNVNVNVNVYNNFTRNVNRADRANRIKTDRGGVGDRGTWQHSPENRRGAQYRDSATQQRFNRSDSSQAASREAFRGRAEQGRQDLSRGGAGQGVAGGSRSREGGAGPAGGGPRGGGGQGAAGAARSREGGVGPAGGAQRGGGAGAAGIAPGNVGRQRDSAGGGRAFDGIGQGRNQGSYSQRGHSSLDSSRSTSNAGRGGGASRPSGGGGARGGGGGGKGGGAGR
jgi:hypothetical protein